MAQKIFQRIEKKYMISRKQHDMLMQYISDKVTPDAYGEYTISNLYFDTADYDLIRASIEKPVYKEKLRLRCYGRAEEDSTVFLELKKKFDGVVFKRRVAMPYSRAVDFISGKDRPCDREQIISEIEYFMSMYRVQPVIFISYDRRAFAGAGDDGLRITFDTNIRFRQSELRLDSSAWGTEILEPDTMLMEIKAPGAMPLWLAGALSGLEIFPASFSKYGVCYSRHIASRHIAGKINHRQGVAESA